jgi:hypothetical protein
MVVYPHENHGFTGLLHIFAKMKREINWFQKCLGARVNASGSQN